LEVLTQIMTRHRQQQGVKVNTAPQVLLEPLAPLGIRLVHLFHIPVYLR
jgi:hypothetical protein